MFDRSHNAGQSTIEFLVTFTFVFGIIIFIHKMVMNITQGYMVHYATYMASRTYLVFDNNAGEADAADNIAYQEAIKTFESFNLAKMLPPDSISVKVLHPQKSGARKVLFSGIYTDFKIPFSISNLFGGREPILLRSESLLGKEPTRATCLKGVCNAFMEVGGDCSDHNSTYFDNGC